MSFKKNMTLTGHSQ